ncbi:50S ribosomal protein P1 [Candidatus Woesearchaeota archaeon]|jgi:large subunit ribosomal protein L12|nr:50S ribosomal protein P1 [Candidatus Woesearchaeota archaeon]
MEYVYAAMLIHKAGGKVEEATLKKVLEAANVTVDEARVKAVVAALDGVDINEAIEKAAIVAAPAAAPAADASASAPKEEAKKEKEEPKEEAAAGLGALFG